MNRVEVREDRLGAAEYVDGGVTTVLALITDAAARFPDRTAVVCGDVAVSYRALMREVDRLAHALVERGVVAEDQVCLAFESSPWVAIAMLAVMKVGAAYVPIDPSYPPARLKQMVDAIGHRRVPLVLATSATAERLPGLLGTVFELDRAWSSEHRGELAGPPSLDSLAYVIFTSGSTGRPKGVMVPHRGLTSLVKAQIETFAISAESTVLQFASLAFDASVSEVFTTLASGATLVLAPRDELAPGPKLVELVQRHRVTVATLPPSSLALLDPDELSSLRTVVSAGEACSAALVARWSKGRRFINAYGPTEVTVCATMAECELTADDRPPGIGAPLPGRTVALLDRELRPVEPGEVGELYLGGAGLARGYLDAPGLTAERFVPDPAGDAGARMYRSGDLARCRDDGALVFCGRADDQIKVRGHRIELGEIEAVARSVPGVRDALAVARELRPGDVRLVAYVVGDDRLDLAAIRNAAEARLPVFARPTDVVLLADWPRAPTGKIDRDRLPLPIRTRRSTEVTNVARTELEYKLIAIWQQVLGVDEVGPNDDFFELGGHSLHAAQMLWRVHAELAIELPLSLIAARRTVAGLALAIASRGHQIRVSSPVRLRAGSAEPLFLAPPGSGSALAYLPLVRNMSADRSLFAFHIAGLDGSCPTPESIEDIAAAFVRDLLAVRSSGPYLLGGWSSGGALAIEIALQLEQAGREVPTIIMIDTTAPPSNAMRSDFGELTPERCAVAYVMNFARCFGIDLGLDKSHFAGVPVDRLAHAAHEALRSVPMFAPELEPQRLAVHLAVFQSILRAYCLWQPSRPYRGRLIHLVANDGHPDFDRERIDWSPYLATPMETVSIPGDHFSLMNPPHVTAVAAALDRVLAELP